jgi:hypothetical protein
MTPAYPEPVAGILRLVGPETRLDIPVPIMRLRVRGAEGFALRISTESEPVYWLEQPGGAEVPVPMHAAGECDRNTTARAFFTRNGAFGGEISRANIAMFLSGRAT